MVAHINTKTLPACLESVVVESLGTDGTVEITRSDRARMIEQDLLGFGKQQRCAINTGSG